MSDIYIHMSEENMNFDTMREAHKHLVTGLSMAGYTVKSSESSMSTSRHTGGEWGKYEPVKYRTISIQADKVRD